MNSLLCYLIGTWTSIKLMASVSGCDYREVECSDRNLHILRCDRCGRFSVAWRYQMPAGWEAA